MTSTLSARKTIFCFPKYSERMVFPKNLHWNMVFFLSSAKMVFLFPRNMFLFLRWKIKDDLSQKKDTWKYLIFFKCSEKKVSPKTTHCNMIILLSSGKMGFLFTGNMQVFLRTEDKRWPSSKNIWKYDAFCMFGKAGISFSYKYEMTLLPKKERWSFPEKYT